MPTTTKYIWDENNIIAEADENDNIDVECTYEPQQYGNLISTKIGGTSHYHHYDALGSTRQLTNAAGTVTDRMTYDAWGNVVSRTGTTPISMLWIGEVGYYYDSETGLFSVRERPYDPENGRWILFDSNEFAESSNMFVYAQNSSVSRIDPSGELSQATELSGIGYEGIFLPVVIVGQCGAFTWTTRWILGQPEIKKGNGFIIQRVTFPTWNPQPCAVGDNPQPQWQNPGKVCSQGGYGYFEIWRVQGNQILAGNVFANANQPSADDTFALAGYTSPTRGRFVEKGHAFFIADTNITPRDLQQLTNTFQGPPNGVAAAGGLYSVCFDRGVNSFINRLAARQTGASTDKSATRSWDCCCVNKQPGANTLIIEIDGNSTTYKGTPNDCGC